MRASISFACWMGVSAPCDVQPGIAVEVWEAEHDGTTAAVNGMR